MSTSAKPAGVVERATYRSDRQLIDLWVMRPRMQGRFPVLIYNHGSRLRADGRIDAACPTLSFETPAWNGVRDGLCAVVFPEGRGYGASTGPTLADCRSHRDVRAFLRGRARDVVAGVRWLDGQDWADTSKLTICGCSHGGIVSFLAQADLGVCGTVMQAPAAGGQARDAEWPDLLDALDRTDAPVLLQHAHHDLHAPIEFSRALRQLGTERAKDVYLLEYPFRRDVSSHGQFDWRHRRIWGPDFDSFICRSFGVSGHVVCEASRP